LPFDLRLATGLIRIPHQRCLFQPLSLLLFHFPFIFVFILPEGGNDLSFNLSSPPPPGDVEHCATHCRPLHQRAIRTTEPMRIHTRLQLHDQIREEGAREAVI
jgi:hypothetical protein